MSGGSSSDILSLLRGMVVSESSDLHLVCGYPPMVRTHGLLRAAGDSALDGASIRRMVEAVLPEAARSRIGVQKNIDCSVTIPAGGETVRFRANVFFARGEVGACLRYVPNRIPSFEWMGIPESIVERITSLQQGLVVISGVTGSGKTTTLAGLIDRINARDGRRIITVEEPIEYIFAPAGTSVVSQREVGVDVDSFYDGLVSGLRQDPDVILVGEIRDRATAQMAISAAETGHLILTTLHTQDVKGAVTRLIDLFPRDAQDDVRTQLSLSLRVVLCQHLLPGVRDNEKRALALEVLTATHAVRAAIRFGKIESIESALQTGRKDGMVSLDESLAHLATTKRISWETAKRFAKDPNSISDYVSAGR